MQIALLIMAILIMLVVLPAPTLYPPSHVVPAVDITTEGRCACGNWTLKAGETLVLNETGQHFRTQTCLPDQQALWHAVPGSLRARDARLPRWPAAGRRRES
jgi:hypothetical protein